jgi:hypothetical protein
MKKYCIDVNMSTTTPSDSEIRKILNDDDIERLRKRFLCSIKDMDNDPNNSYEYKQVYDRMGLGRYNLPLASIVIRDYLLPQQLIEDNGERVKITDKGRHRCIQLRHTNDVEWKQTMDKMNRLQEKIIKREFNSAG